MNSGNVPVKPVFCIVVCISPLMRATSLEADLVNLLRRQVERRELPDHRLVVGFAVRQLLGGQRGARLDQIFLADEVEQLRIRGHDALGDDAARFGTHLFLLVGRDRRRQRLERQVQRVGLVRLQVGLDRAIATRDRNLRHGEAAREAGAHVDDLLVEVARHVAQSAEIAAILVRRGIAFARREVGPEERVGVERRFVGLVAHVDDLLFEHGAEYLRVELLFGRQLLQRNLVEVGEHLLPVLQPLLLAGRVDTRQVIGGSAAPDLAGLARELFLSPVPLGVVQRLETLIGCRPSTGVCATSAAGDNSNASTIVRMQVIVM